MEAILYQSGPACRIYLLADRSNCPSDSFLTAATHLQRDEFAKLTKLLDSSALSNRSTHEGRIQRSHSKWRFSAIEKGENSEYFDIPIGDREIRA